MDSKLVLYTLCETNNLFDLSSGSRVVTRL